VGELANRAVLTLCLASLWLVACSGQPDELRQRETNAAQERVMAQGTATAGDGLVIEEAVLRAGEEGDFILVVVRTANPMEFPRCLLMNGPTRDAPKGEGSKAARSESPWPDYGLTEVFDMGRKHVTIFHEDRDREGEVADPRRTPFFVSCQIGLGPGERDEVHVEGTPEAT
jgi:hypothetical protein